MRSFANVFFLVTFWILVSYAIGKFAQARGHSFGTAFLASILLSPLLTFIIIALLPPGELASMNSGMANGITKTCPFCAEPIKIQATTCRYCGKDVPQVVIHRVPYAKPASVLSVTGISLILGLIVGLIGFAIYVNEKQDGDNKSPSITSQQPPRPETEPVTSASQEPPIDEKPATYGADWVIIDGQKIESITRVTLAPDDQVHIATPTMGQNILINKVPKGFLDEWHVSPSH